MSGINNVRPDDAKTTPGRAEPTRRVVLGGVAAAVAAGRLSATRSALAQALSPGQPLPGKALIVARASPLVAEAPLAGITSWRTPIDRFPILTSLATTFPDLAPDAWRLTIEGLVERPVTLTYTELLALPATTVTSVVECAGNSRNSVSPPFPRSFLGNGFVGNAEWKGVQLRLLLEQAGLKPSAVEIVLEGADRGKTPLAPQEIAFAKSVPVDKALHPDTLLAYEMNGVPVPREYGGPVRAIVPGWYGTYQVKWLTRVEALDAAFDGVFMTRSWRLKRKQNGVLRDDQVTQIVVKSLITSPAPGQRLMPGAQMIRGVAWSGGNDVASVRVSTDGGGSWRFARLLDPGAPYAWRLWEMPWQATKPGSHTLMARALDTSGAAQPFAYDPDLSGFEVNHVQAVTVEVGA